MTAHITTRCSHIHIIKSAHLVFCFLELLIFLSFVFHFRLFLCFGLQQMGDKSVITCHLGDVELHSALTSGSRELWLDEAKTLDASEQGMMAKKKKKTWTKTPRVNIRRSWAASASLSLQPPVAERRSSPARPLGAAPLCVWHRRRADIAQPLRGRGGLGSPLRRY